MKKANKLGYPKLLQNGSIVISKVGLFEYLKEGHVEMISSQTSMSPEAAKFGELLPPHDLDLLTLCRPYDLDRY